MSLAPFGLRLELDLVRADVHAIIWSPGRLFQPADPAIQTLAWTSFIATDVPYRLRVMSPMVAEARPR